MSQPDNLTVQDALAAQQELSEMLSAASTEDRQWLMQEAATDPVYQEAEKAQSDLGRLANAFAQLIEQRQTGEAEIAKDSPNTNYDIEALLADLEDDPTLAEKAALQREDIASAHDFADKYAFERRTINRKPNKKDEAVLERTLKREFRNRWTAEEMANQPLRLMSVLDSITCKEGVSDQVKSTLINFISSEVSKYVGENAAQTSPEVIGERLLACFTPSFVQEKLKRALIAPYFRAAESREIDVLMDNYESFIRGILRVGHLPEICAGALDVALFKTPLLGKDSTYDKTLTIIPAIRLDRPELFARITGISRTIQILRLNMGNNLLSEDLNRPDEGNIFGTMSTAMDNFDWKKFEKGDYIKLMTHGTGMERLIALHASEAVTTLGGDKEAREEYQERFSAFARIQELISDRSYLQSEYFEESHQLNDNDSNYEAVPQAIMVIIKMAIKEFPKQENFLRSLINTQCTVQDELPLFIHDKSGDVRWLNSFMAEELQEMLGKLLPQLEYEQPEDEEIPENMGEWMQEHTKTISYRTDDGFIIETNLLADSPDFTIEEWQALLEEHAGKIGQVKDSIVTRQGATRRHEFLGLKGSLPLLIRRESEEDRKGLHPIDEILRLDFEGHEGESADQALESCQRMVIEERRRFLNKRGIEFFSEVEDDEDVESLLMQIHKHPRNPQNFIVTVEAVVDGQRHRAKLLMDSQLRFQLGDKKVTQPEGLKWLNVYAAEFLSAFMCNEAVETTEGTISDEKNALTSRIAHLRLLPDGQNYSYKQWEICLEDEGLDLEVLSDLQALKKVTTRKSTYVKALEDDDPSKGPLRIILSSE